MAKIQFSGVTNDLRSLSVPLCAIFAHPTHVTLYDFPFCLRRYKSFPFPVGFPIGPSVVGSNIVGLWSRVVLMILATCVSMTVRPLCWHLTFIKSLDDFKDVFIFLEEDIIYFNRWFRKSISDILPSKITKALNYFMSKIHKILKVFFISNIGKLFYWSRDGISIFHFFSFYTWKHWSLIIYSRGQIISNFLEQQFTVDIYIPVLFTSFMQS